MATTTALRRLWAALTRERTVAGRRPRRGVAMLLVLVSLATMSAVVADFSYNQEVRLRLAMRERDLLKAQYLARGGVEMGRILLAFQEQIQPLLDFATETLKLPLPGFTIWQLIPLDSDLLRAFASGEIQESLGFAIDRDELKQKVRKVVKEIREGDSTSTPEESEQAAPDNGGFGAFEGGFRVDIEDEDSRLSLRPASDQTASAAQKKQVLRYRLLALVEPQKYNFMFEEPDGNGQRLDRFEFIGAFFDWVDADRDRVDARLPERFPADSMGDEDATYDALDERYKPKNAYFDSHDEMRLIAGMDDVKWKVFGPAVSIHSDGLVNIKSATNPTVIEGLIAACAEPPLMFQGVDYFWLQDRVNFWQYIRSEGLALGMGTVNPDGFVAMLGIPSLQNFPGIQVNKERCKASMKTKSEVFTMRVRAEVGDAVRTRVVTLRIFQGRPEYWYFHEE
ncbi:MAG: general secretion pathway protein GspK [Deltaproteobacteria bacterium]|nr:general secretion pathway protein GspK [Deltaproteobacteria bacterium]